MTLQQKRRSLDMALGELARGAGLTVVEMSRIERGKLTPTDEQCAAIGKVIGWSARAVLAALPEPTADTLPDSMLAYAATSDDAKQRGLGRGNGGPGKIPCPICKGELHYYVSILNGHIWGRCMTDGCVRWMQ